MTSGRLPELTDAIKLKIIERVENGESIKAISRDKDIPSAATIYKHLDKDSDFYNALSAAKKIRAKVLKDEIFENSKNVETTISDGHGGHRTHSAGVAACQLRNDWTQWYASLDDETLSPASTFINDENLAGVEDPALLCKRISKRMAEGRLSLEKGQKMVDVITKVFQFDEFEKLKLKYEEQQKIIEKLMNDGKSFENS